MAVIAHASTCSVRSGGTLLALEGFLERGEVGEQPLTAVAERGEVLLDDLGEQRLDLAITDAAIAVAVVAPRGWSSGQLGGGAISPRVLGVCLDVDLGKLAETGAHYLNRS